MHWSGQRAVEASESSLDFCDRVNWNADGLVPAVAQDRDGTLLMMAWMNREALALSVAERRAVYWSRSRQQLWRKGERSGMTQTLESLWLDCDGDTVLLRVSQQRGIACHTGRRSCFYRRLDCERGAWDIAAPVLTDPEQLYAKPTSN